MPEGFKLIVGLPYYAKPIEQKHGVVTFNEMLNDGQVVQHWADTLSGHTLIRLEGFGWGWMPEGK